MTKVLGIIDNILCNAHFVHKQWHFGSACKILDVSKWPVTIFSKLIVMSFTEKKWWGETKFMKKTVSEIYTRPRSTLE